MKNNWLKLISESYINLNEGGGFSDKEIRKALAQVEAKKNKPAIDKAREERKAANQAQREAEERAKRTAEWNALKERINNGTASAADYEAAFGDDDYGFNRNS